MRNFWFPSLCAALLVANAGCIIDRGSGAQRDSSDDSDEAPVYRPPPRTRAKPRPAPTPAPPDATPPAPASPPAPANPVVQRADQADHAVDDESTAHGRVVISNLDENGAPIAGTTGNPQDNAIPGDENSAVGAPGANASADELARAWPGAKPIANATPEGTAEDPAPPAPPPAALPYSAPGGAADGTSQAQAVSTNGDAAPPPAGTEVDPRSFEKPLRGYGRWVETPDYGRVWIPYVDSDWQPYSDGAWSNTEYGWTFTSYDPWGWAVWHYGSWGFRARIGWYWVPGRVWGPAWVSWRWGGGYACWRPIAPWGVWGAGWGNRGWVGVPAAHFTQPIRGGNVLRGSSIRVAVSHSQVLPGPTARPVAGGAYGPPVGSVSQAIGHPVRTRQATQVVRQANIAARSAAAQEGRASARERAAAPRENPRPQTQTGQTPRAQTGANRGVPQNGNRRGGAPGAGPRTRTNGSNARPENGEHEGEAAGHEERAPANGEHQGGQTHGHGHAKRN